MQVVVSFLAVSRVSNICFHPIKADMVHKAFTAQRNFIATASKHQQPSQVRFINCK